MTHNSRSVKRYDRGSWAALLYAIFIFGFVSLIHWVAWRLPSDGWNIQFDLPKKITLQANLLGLDSDLQPGDVLLEIDGRPILDYARAAFSFTSPVVPAWRDGQVLSYTVLRGDQQLVVEVPIRQFSPLAQIIGSLRAAVGVTSPGAALLEVAASLVFFGVSLFTFLLRPRQPPAQALLVIGSAFFYQHYYLVTSPLLLANPFIMRTLAAYEGWIWAILPAFSYLMLAFPHPKWPVRRFPRLTVILLFGGGIGILLLPNLIFFADFDRVLVSVRQLTTLGLIFLVIPLVANLHSQFIVHDPVERAQLKWITLGMLGFIAGGLVFTLGQTTRWNLILSFIQNGGYLMLPVCIAVAVVRYHLFDIDLIIRKTLVYGLITAVLALVYFGLVALLQGLFSSLSAQQSPISIVLSTLAIAVLFTPLRTLVQDFIDQRFYRRKYNAQQAVEKFATITRVETNLNRLSLELVQTIRETVQPEDISLWLKEVNR